MRRTASGLLDNVSPLIDAAATRHPEWHALIASLGEIARATLDPAWETAAQRATLPLTRHPDAPILDGAVLAVPGDALATLIANLIDGEIRRSDAAGMIEGSIAHDYRAIDAIAFGTDRDAAALAAQIALAAMPLLQACARVHHERIPRDWPHGYCPVCAAWPAIAELVGVDRTRRVRCGRCAAAWALPPLRCLFCGEQDHEQLGRLVPEATRETRFIELCKSCGGYIKTLTTLESSGALELTVRDLDTVELDLVALKEGFARPTELGYPLRVELTA